MGDFNPLAHVKGVRGFNSIALICNKYSATCKPTSTFESMEQKYIVHHQGSTLTFSQIEFNDFARDKSMVFAAGGLVENEFGQFLFMERLNCLDLPKGKLENGESAEDGATREVMEETGLAQLTLGKKIIVTFHTYFLLEKWYLKQTTWFRMKVEGKPQLTPQIEEGITRVSWLSVADVENLISNTYESIQLVWNSAKD
jgi:8-oxo-dGTP pyrophosphatase MutT (NUDIX family)